MLEVNIKVNGLQGEEDEGFSDNNSSFAARETNTGLRSRGEIRVKKKYLGQCSSGEEME